MATEQKRIEALEKERDDWKATAKMRFDQYTEARDGLHALSYPEANADLLDAVAGEIDCGGNEQDCDHVSIEWDTNASNCSRNDRADDKIGCRFDAACELRAQAKALRLKAALSKAKE